MPKIIVTSQYLQNTAHFVNYLEYAGEKLEAQEITWNDGGTQALPPDQALDLLNEELCGRVSSVAVTFKDGHTSHMSPERYLAFTAQKSQKVKSWQLTGEDGAIRKENVLDPATYLNYIATRPSVEKNPDLYHGLFGTNGPLNLEEVKRTAAEHGDSIHWSEIISLTRADAERTGFDNRAAWEILIQAKAQDIAALYHIDPQNFVLQAAYHDKDHHPHIHLFFYSANAREGKIAGGVPAMTKTTEKLKSLFLNEIFRGDVEHLKAQKNDRESRLASRLEELTRQIAHKNHDPPGEMSRRIGELAESLRDVGGRKYYGYLPPELKQQVNDILRCALEQDACLREVYESYRETYREFVSQYVDAPEKIERKLQKLDSRILDPKKGESTQLQNAIIRATLQLTAAAPALEAPPPLNDVSNTEKKKTENPGKLPHQIDNFRPVIAQAKTEHSDNLLGGLARLAAKSALYAVSHELTGQTAQLFPYTRFRQQHPDRNIAQENNPRRKTHRNTIEY